MDADDLLIASGTMLMVGLPGPELDAATARRLSRLRPGGIILFKRNLDTAQQTMALAAELRALLGRPCLMAVDQEGGRVSRLAHWIGPTPSAASLAASGEATTRRFAEATGRALCALGFNLDFAPVVDLCAGEVANGIGDRSFGPDPDVTVRMGRAYLDGLAQAGIAGCLKHFPGLGCTGVDSHESLPTVHRSRASLEQEELVPFRLLAPHAPSVMVGHGHYPALDPEPRRPASLSPPIVSGLLRSEMGFGGLVASDDLEMGAVASLDEGGAVAIQAAAAGCDLLLYCSDLARAEIASEAMAARASRDGAFRRRLEEGSRVVARLAARLAQPPGDLAAWDGARRELSSQFIPGRGPSVS
jgi:beta-N-acetylhexosaminidase